MPMTVRHNAYCRRAIVDYLSHMDSARISEIIAMAWDDETSFDAIEQLYGLSEAETIKLMRREMKPSSFRMWRKRVSSRATKHEKKHIKIKR
jgi:uncharacterized protein (TIGR03643 family)